MTSDKALGMACAGGNIAIVKHLIQCDPRVCCDTFVALMNACGQGNVEIVDILLQNEFMTKEALISQGIWMFTSLY
jgi:hypothetical protein